MLPWEMEESVQISAPVNTYLKRDSFTMEYLWSLDTWLSATKSLQYLEIRAAVGVLKVCERYTLKKIFVWTEET